MADRIYIDKAFACSGMLKLPKAMPMEHVEIFVIQAMKKAGVNPAAIFAYEKTLYFITFENHRYYPKKALDQWDKAQEEYRRLIRND